MVRTLLMTFIPLFVAMDVVAVVLVCLGIGMPLQEAARRRLVLEATITAAAVGLGFLLVGDGVLDFLGVTVGDFQVAGGIQNSPSVSPALVPVSCRSAFR